MIFLIISYNYFVVYNFYLHLQPMNKAFNKISLTLILLVLSVSSNAGQGPPPPRDSRGPGPGLPLDDNIALVMILVLLFGIYKIYSFNKTKKTSI